MAPPADPFVFPREYHFPPFFTRQTNLTTHHAQLTKWAALVLAYCRHHRIFKLSLSASAPTESDGAGESGGPAAASAAVAAATAATGGGGGGPGSGGAAVELFYNRKLQRRLVPADVREVVEFMRKDGRAEYVGGNGGGGDVVWIYWRSPEEWAALIEAWVDETAQKGTVMTLYELVEGDGTLGTDIHGIDADLLQKALQVLVKRGKAQIFGQEDSQGVKFF